MRVVPEALQEVADVLVHVRVVRDVVHESIVLLLIRKLSVTQQPRYLQERRLLGKLLDRVSAIAQDSLVAVDVGDRAATRGGVHERRIVRQQTNVVRIGGLYLSQIGGSDRAVLDRKVVVLVGPLVGDR